LTVAAELWFAVVLRADTPSCIYRHPACIGLSRLLSVMPELMLPLMPAATIDLRIVISASLFQHTLSVAVAKMAMPF
jgi:hypothetical protein